MLSGDAVGSRGWWNKAATHTANEGGTEAPRSSSVHRWGVLCMSVCQGELCRDHEVALSLSGFMYNYLQERWGRLSRVLAPAYRVVTFLIMFLSV